MPSDVNDRRRSKAAAGGRPRLGRVGMLVPTIVTIYQDQQCLPVPGDTYA